MKFKVVFSILILLILCSFTYAIYLSLKLERTIQMYIDAGLKIEYLENENSKQLIEYAKLLNEGNKNSWEIATRTNTLTAYSLYMGDCDSKVEDCHEEELENKINALLNGKGYVQMIETNGNELFTAVNLNLDGEFIKFNSSRSVRNGAIGISDCGASNSQRTGDSVLKDKIVKVLKKCEASGSKSVWAHIQYAK